MQPPGPPPAYSPSNGDFTFVSSADAEGEPEPQKDPSPEWTRGPTRRALCRAEAVAAGCGRAGSRSGTRALCACRALREGPSGRRVLGSVPGYSFGFWLSPHLKWAHGTVRFYFCSDLLVVKQGVVKLARVGVREWKRGRRAVFLLCLSRENFMLILDSALRIQTSLEGIRVLCGLWYLAYLPAFLLLYSVWLKYSERWAQVCSKVLVIQLDVPKGFCTFPCTVMRKQLCRRDFSFSAS